MEERILSLGWAVTLDEQASLRPSAEADLCGVATWKHDDLEKTDGLAVAHIARTLSAALQHWHWIGVETKTTLTDGLNHLVEKYGSWLDNEKEWWRRRKAEPRHPDFANPLHNIHFIQTVGLCLAARATKHALADCLELHVQQFALAILEQHASGVSEGVSYDGYVLDFMMDWAAGAPAELQKAVLDHLELQEFLNQPAVLGAPGNLLQVAPLGDVEPVEMPFHASALAKWRKLRSSTTHDWQLSQLNLRMLRTDALIAIIKGPEPAGDPVAPINHRTRAAIVLRSGNSSLDIAVAMSAHAAAMGHLHHDNGSIVIAAGGQWIINDPGYQQYMNTAEREFSVGSAAHNAPVINGQAQMKRDGRVTQEPALSDGAWHTAIDLLNCYELPLTRCTRSIWLTGDQLVIVADEIAGSALGEIAYHWHGHPDAAWWVEDGIALVCLHNEQLWIRCMNCSLDASQVDRRKGSRGHLTLGVQIQAKRQQVIWWAFGRHKASVQALTVNGVELRGHGAVYRGCPGNC
jgi:hypothetical protein